MPVQPPPLDDRNFAQLLEEAKVRVARACPTWTDFSPQDPGMTLLELFAHLTETMIYRLNRLPDKAYAAFLSMIGVKLQPPCAAGATLVFTLNRAAERPVVIPRGTRVTVARSGGEAPVFVTDEELTIEPKQTSVTGTAHHCDVIEAEEAGRGTGLAGLTIKAKKPPIVDALDLWVGVEAAPGELKENDKAVLVDNRPFRIWREVENFTDLGDDRWVYMVDRNSGLILFAPALDMAEVPGANREIRLWYRRGGGPLGNVAANTLAVLKDPVPGVTVNNPTPATGGRAAESLDSALVRGPQELHSLKRAVTARDFERVALDASGAISRAKAFSQAGVWKYAMPGTVEILIVPAVDGPVTHAKLVERQSEEVLRRIHDAVEERRPLGVQSVTNWVRYKNVRVQARMMVHRQENPDAVKARVVKRLHDTLSPMTWRFGEPLRASHVYEVMLSEPGVKYVDEVKLLVEDVPDKDVTALAADPIQERLWYAAAGENIYRSMNDGEGWEASHRIPGESISEVRVHPQRPGWVVATTKTESGSRVYVSSDSGQSWRRAADVNFKIEDAAWMSDATLLLACDRGLYKLETKPGSTPVQMKIDGVVGLYAVVAVDSTIAVAAQQEGGVYLSTQGKPFRPIGLKNEDIRVLAVQRLGPRDFLWAGAYAPGTEAGKGAFRWELRGLEDPPDGWRPFAKNWKGGSCYNLAFQDDRVIAATFHMGVLTLDASEWKEPSVTCGLPLRDIGRLQQVKSVAVRGGLILAGGPDGIFRSSDGGENYQRSTKREFTDKVMLPETWLFCPGDHEIEVKSEHAAS